MTCKQMLASIVQVFGLIAAAKSRRGPCSTRRARSCGLRDSPFGKPGESSLIHRYKSSVHSAASDTVDTAIIPSPRIRCPINSVFGAKQLAGRKRVAVRLTNVAIYGISHGSLTSRVPGGYLWPSRQTRASLQKLATPSPRTRV